MHQSTQGAWILWLKIFGLMTAIGIGFALLATIKVIFLPLLVAIVLHILLMPLVGKLERRGVRQDLAVMTVFFGFIGGLVATGYAVADLARSELAMFLERWPESQANLMGMLQAAEAFVNDLAPADRQIDFAQTMGHQLSILVDSIVASLPVMLTEGVMGVALVFVFTFFLLRDGRRLKKAVVAAVPNRYFEMTLSILYRTNQQVSNYLRGLTLVALTDGTLAVIFSLILDVPNPLLIGLIVGATTLMPVVGFAFSAVAGPMVAVLGGTGDPLTLILTVLGIIGVIHLIDNLITAPMIMGHSVQLHPAIVIISIVLAGKFFGILGVIMAIPTVSILKVLLQEGYHGVKSNQYYLKTLPEGDGLEGAGGG